MKHALALSSQRFRCQTRHQQNKYEHTNAVIIFKRLMVFEFNPECPLCDRLSDLTTIRAEI